MMNVVALFLVLSSFVTAGLWSPPPEKHPNPTTQNGHQKLIIEFDKEDGNTKVFISPQESHFSPVPLDDKCHIPTAKDELSTGRIEGTAAVEDSIQKFKGAMDKCREKAREVEERAKEASFKVSRKACEVGNEAKDVIREASDKAKERGSEKAREVKEAVGDVSERAKQKASEKVQEAQEVVRDVTQKAKEKASEKAQEVKDKASEKAQEAKEAVRDVTQKAKEKASEKAQEVKDKATEKVQDAKEAVGDVTQKAKEKASEKVKEAKEKASEKAQEAKEAVGDVTEGAKERVWDATEKAKETVREKARNLQEGVEEKAKEKVEKVAGTVKGVMEEGEKDLNDILRRGREVGYDVLVYVVSPRAVEPATGVVHLLGFAAAYGICLWVTFISSYVLAGALDRRLFGVVQSKIYPVYFRTMAYCVALALFAHLLSNRKRMLANYRGVEVFLGYNLLASLIMILFNLLYLEPRATKVMFERTKLEKEEGRGRESFISEPISKAAADPTVDFAGITARGAEASSKTPFSKEGQRRESSISETGGKSAADPTADSAAIPAHGADATSASPLRPEELEQVAARSQIIELSERLKKLNAYSSLLNILTLMLLTWHLVYLGQHLHVAC